MIITFTYQATHSLMSGVDADDSVIFESKMVSLQPKKNVDKVVVKGKSARIRSTRIFSIAHSWQFQTPKAWYDNPAIEYQDAKRWDMMLDTLDNGGDVLVAGLPNLPPTAFRLVETANRQIVDNEKIKFRYSFELEYIE